MAPPNLTHLQRGFGPLIDHDRPLVNTCPPPIQNPGSAHEVRDALTMFELFELPPEDKWRLPYLCKLLNQRREAEVLGMEQVEEVINELISSLVKN